MPLFSQLRQVQHYPFINYEANKIEYCGNSATSFEKFYRKFIPMIKNGKGQVRILHIGDSHLQADFFSGRVRHDFQSIMMGLEGSRGMVSPYNKGCPDSYKISFSNNWIHYNLLSTLYPHHKTIFANTVFTTDTTANINIEVNFRNPIKYEFNSLCVYHSLLGQGDSIFLDLPEGTYTQQYDSTKGCTLYLLDSYTDKANIKTKKQTNDTLYIYGFYFDNEDAGVVYNAVGVNSAEARHYLGIDQRNILLSLDLDMIIISLGTNDCYLHNGVGTY